MSTLAATKLSTMLHLIFRVIAWCCCTLVRVPGLTQCFFAEGVTKTELLAIRFGTPENAALFKVRDLIFCLRMCWRFSWLFVQEHFGKAQKLNSKLGGGASGSGSAVVSPAVTPSQSVADSSASPATAPWRVCIVTLFSRCCPVKTNAILYLRFYHSTRWPLFDHRNAKSPKRWHRKLLRSRG
jgi:hypothetical protein